MIPAKTINGVAVTTSGPALCLACHDARDSWFGAGYPSTAAPVRDGGGYPVSGTWTGPATYASTSNAHRLIPETTVTAGGGSPQPRQRGDCLYCHAAHRGGNAYDSLLSTFTVPTAATLSADKSGGDYAAVCFECHGGVKPSGFATAPVDVKRFSTSASGSSGHAIVTPGGLLPVGAPLPCFECHNPHGSRRGNESMITDERGGSLETSTSSGVRAFCFTCHTTAGAPATGWDSEVGAYTAVAPADKIVGIPRDGGVLHLSLRVGHDASDTSSCYDCHGDSYSVGGSNVHAPLTSVQAIASNSVSASDTVAPVTIADLSTAASGTVSLAATDTGSGVDVTYFTLDGGALAVGTFVVATSEGTHTVQYWSTDAARNVESTNTTMFVVDRTAPVTTSDAAPSYRGTATINLIAEDGAVGTGVSATWFSLDGSSETTGSIVTTSAVGDHSLTYWSVDGAGNVEASQVATFAITDPTATSMLGPSLTGGLFSAALDAGPVRLPLLGRSPPSALVLGPARPGRLNSS